MPCEIVSYEAARAHSADGILYGLDRLRSPESGPQLPTGRDRLTPWATGTETCCFEDHDGWSGTDHWAIWSRSLPVLLKTSDFQRKKLLPGQTQHQNFPPSKIRKLCEHAWMPDAPMSRLRECDLASASEDTSPASSLAPEHQKILLDGIEVGLVAAAHTEAVEYCCDHGGKWMYSDMPQALCYLAPASGGSSKLGGVIGIVKVDEFH